MKNHNSVWMNVAPLEVDFEVLGANGAPFEA